MVPSLRALLAAVVSRARPRPCWWLGHPYRATITPYPAGGYFLKIARTQGCERVDLADRTNELGDDHPDDRDFAAATDALAARGVAWVLPWELDQHGNLTAPLTPYLHADDPSARGGEHRDHC